MQLVRYDLRVVRPVANRVPCYRLCDSRRMRGLSAECRPASVGLRFANSLVYRILIGVGHTEYVAQFLKPADMLSAGMRKVSANPRACNAGGNVGTISAYQSYRTREIEAGNIPLRFELWQLREMGKDESARNIRNLNAQHKTPMPKVSQLRKPKYHKVDVSDTPVYAGDRTNNRPDSRHKRTPNITLPIATYNLSADKRGGVPLVADTDGNVDVRLSLAFLMMYRYAIAENYRLAKTSGNPRKEDKNGDHSFS